MSNRIQVKIEELNALPATKIVENANVEAKFIQMYNAIWGVSTGVQIYQKEVFNFQKVLREKPALAECTRMSLFGCFLDMAVNGLSLDPTGRPHCYLIPRSVNSGYKDQNGRDIFEKRASVSVTAYGELLMRMRAGQIKYADNPVVVYEGDTFGAEMQSGKKVVTYSAAIPRKSSKVIGAFIRIVRPDGSEDYQWMLEGNIEILKSYSEVANSYWKDGQKVRGKANDLYTSNNGSIDPGFLENKMIKHAFDAYPKVRIGKFTQFETTEEPEPEIDYGVEDAGYQELPTGNNKVAFGEDPHTPAPFTQEVIIPVTQEDDDAGF
jgi:recombinational DNA repair protein RecT